MRAFDLGQGSSGVCGGVGVSVTGCVWKQFSGILGVAVVATIVFVISTTT